MRRGHGIACWMLAVGAAALLLVGGAQPSLAQQAPDTLPTGVGYTRGEAQAPVSVLEFSDYGCGYCAVFDTRTFPELEREFIATGRVRWTYVPIRLQGYSNADEAAEAAECAGEQQAFWPMHARLFAERKRWSGADEPMATFLTYARDLKLDATQFQQCTESRSLRGRILEHTSLARVMGARATPTFFINGRRVEGALPAARFRMLLERELVAQPSTSTSQ